MHRGVTKNAVGIDNPGTPMKDLPEDVGPIMAIASITFAPKPHFEAISLPISQISIELYKPITGGIFLGGRFAPDSLIVLGIRDLTPKTKTGYN